MHHTEQHRHVSRLPCLYLEGKGPRCLTLSYW